METVTADSNDSSPKHSHSTVDINQKTDTIKAPRETWKCYICNLEEKYDYKGPKPPFAKHLFFSEDCYVMKDPFSASNKGEIIILGADCSVCENSVCVECSLFFSKRFCKVCASKNIEHFSYKLQDKIRHLNNKGNDDSD